MSNVNLFSPWVLYSQEIKAMFGDDPDIQIVEQQYCEPYEIKLLVANQEKADALAELLPTEKSFGNVKLKITVIPANLQSQNKWRLFLAAFEGNPAFVGVKEASGSDVPFDMAYVIFAKRVVQYRSDDISDVYGLESTLYENIARDIFEDCDGVYFCTDTKDPIL